MANSTKSHTQGDWSIRRHTSAPALNGKYKGVVTYYICADSPRGRFLGSVATVGEYRDATLISASPDLLEIAKRYLEEMGTHEACPAQHGVQECLQCAAVAAIAKAEPVRRS